MLVTVFFAVQDYFTSALAVCCMGQLHLSEVVLQVWQHTSVVHYKLKHCHQTRNCPLPCVYADCVCSFRTDSSLKKRSTRDHSWAHSMQVTIRLNCKLCTCSDTQYFAHLKMHTQNKETCLFKDCSFQSSVYRTFHAHKSKKHPLCNVDNFRENLYQT